MSPLRQRPFRPGFDHTVDASPSAVRDALGKLAEGPAPMVAGRFLKHNLLLTVPESQRKFWSPWLHLDIEVHRSQASLAADTATRAYVRGFFTPSPSLWTWFVLTYIALFTLVFFSGSWGVIQWQLGQSPLAWIVTALALLACTCMYLLSRAGRSFAKQQMAGLHAAVEHALTATGPVSVGGAQPVGESS